MRVLVSASAYVKDLLRSQPLAVCSLFVLSSVTVVERIEQLLRSDGKAPTDIKSHANLCTRDVLVTVDL